MDKLNTTKIAASWRPIFQHAIQSLDPHYLEDLEMRQDWLPGPENIFNAFQIELPHTRTILFGESPYPRPESAIGFAFWDGSVHQIWSPTGLSTRANRATSLRHIIKMLLVARGSLSATDISQQAIAKVDKRKFVQTLDELFKNFLRAGIMLLNTTLVLSKNGVKKDAKQWLPFMSVLLDQLCKERSDIQLLLWGTVARTITKIKSASCFKQIESEHPYNTSFITNQKIIEFFKPLDLLRHQP